MRMLLVLVLTLGSILAQATVTVTPLAIAISKAEGFDVKGSLPFRYHNPGDLKAIHGYTYPGQKAVGKGGHVIFRSDKDGWAALQHQIDKIMAGTSRYTIDMDLTTLARGYAGDWKRWSTHVAGYLGVNTKTTLAEIFDLPPTLRVVYDGHELEGIL